MDLAANFEELMQRSPISQHDMKTFLKEMRRTPSGTVAVSKLLAGKMQGSSEAQAIHAFEFLEAALESETEGSIEFRTEIGRYRFLNEIIRILSPKYLGNSTPEAVKERAITFLEDAAGGKRKRWFPSEHSKVTSVYESLIEGGVIPKPTKVTDEDAEFQKSIFERGENAVILKRLLQSKDPSDLQAANRLIKNLVDEEARRNERRAELHSLIDRIETSVGLLAEMLNQRSIDKEIVEELVDTCRSLRQKLGGVETETNEEVTALLQASENIEKVLVLYESKKEYINNLLMNNESDSVNASKGAASASSELSLADQLLMSLGDDQIIGAHSNHKRANGVSEDKQSSQLLLNLDIDLGPGPISKISNEGSENNIDPNPTEPFDEISKLSREMMEQGLKGIPNSTQSKKTDRTPLNQLKRPSQELAQSANLPFISNSTQNILSPTTQPICPESLSLLDLDFLEKPPNFSSSSSVSKTTPSAGPTSSNNLNGKKAESKLSNNNSTSSNSNKHQQSVEKSKINSAATTTAEDENLLELMGKVKSGESNYHNGADNSNENNGKINNKNDPEETNENLRKSKAHAITNSNGKIHGSSTKSEFCLNKVKEIDLEKIDLLDDLKPLELNLEESCKDVSLTLTFGRYPELPCWASVAVVTFSNRSKNTGLLNYVFQLLPPKGLQVKLLPPACMELPPWKKTFLPPPVLTQVALFVIPRSIAIAPASEKTATSPKIKFILSYCVEDETILHNGEFYLPPGLLH